MAVTPHPELPGYYRVGEWEFSIHPEEDGNLTYVEDAIEAWTEWRDFLLKGETDASSEPLF